MPTPDYPAYTSVLAAVSGAASSILTETFPRDEKGFGDLAEESALTDLWAGIHYRHDVEQGLALGRAVGERARMRMQSDAPAAIASR
jgi:hypothetical protein